MVRFPKSSARNEVKKTMEMSLANCLAKTCNEDQPGCGVLTHLVYVGKIAEALWGRLAPDAQSLLPRDVVVLLAALHDVGKISPGFQAKIWQNIAEERRVDEVRRFLETTGEGAERQHTKIGYSALKKSFGKWAEAVGMHHGELCAQESGAVGWQGLRDEAIGKITEIFGPIPINIAKPTREQVELAAGFIVVADWLGSDENFLIDGKVPDATTAERRALEILDDIGWIVPKPLENKTFGDLFSDAMNDGRSFEPNEMQQAFHDVATEPGVFIVEAPTGMGKTEAALWGAHRLLRNRCCNGIYFALPTRTTSDKIHERFEPFLARACADSPAARLTHGTAWTRTQKKNAATSKERTAQINAAASKRETENAKRWKNEEYKVDVIGNSGCDESDGKRFFADGDWFRPSKRALLQAFGVGTVDQALLSVLPQKHAFLRLFGLAGKVVIVDEAHSYDAYTGGLLDELIAKLSKAGATAIILSATLTRKRREEILALAAPSNKNALNDMTSSKVDLSDEASKDKEAPPENDPYPLISYRLYSGEIGRVTASPPPSRTIKIERCERSLRDVAARAVEAAERGELVLCVANTVDRAQALYRLAKSEASARLPAERIGLLHGRFPTFRRETIENEQFAIFGKNGDRSSGALLISTQVVEQSVDLDADFLITDLAPTDLLLQRIGRLWRHNRPNRKALEPRVLIVYPRETVEDAVEESGDASFKTRLEADAYVYAPYVLWRTAEVWRKLDKIVSPTDARRLLEATYKEREETEPEPSTLFSEMNDKVERMRNRAGALTCSGILPTLSNAECHTRYNDTPSVDVLPLRCVDLGKREPTITLLDGRKVKLDKFWRFCDAVALARATISCRKNARLDARRPTLAKKNLTPQILRVYNILSKTYFKFSEILAPFLFNANTGELSTLDESETPFRYTDELGFFEEKDGDAASCREDATYSNDGECDEEFEW